MICGYSHLDEKKVEAIKSLEKSLGAKLVAYDCKDQMKPVELKRPQEQALQKLEQELGVILVAYQ